jgi:hypothetical protein
MEKIFLKFAVGTPEETGRSGVLLDDGTITISREGNDDRDPWPSDEAEVYTETGADLLEDEEFIGKAYKYTLIDSPAYLKRWGNK